MRSCIRRCNVSESVRPGKWCWSDRFSYNSSGFVWLYINLLCVSAIDPSTRSKNSNIRLTKKLLPMQWFAGRTLLHLRLCQSVFSVSCFLCWLSSLLSRHVFEEWAIGEARLPGRLDRIHVSVKPTGRLTFGLMDAEIFEYHIKNSHYYYNRDLLKKQSWKVRYSTQLHYWT